MDTLPQSPTQGQTSPRSGCDSETKPEEHGSFPAPPFSSPLPTPAWVDEVEDDIDENAPFLEQDESGWEDFHSHGSSRLARSSHDAIGLGITFPETNDEDASGDGNVSGQLHQTWDDEDVPSSTSQHVEATPSTWHVDLSPGQESPWRETDPVSENEDDNLPLGRESPPAWRPVNGRRGFRTKHGEIERGSDTSRTASTRSYSGVSSCSVQASDTSPSLLSEEGSSGVIDERGPRDEEKAQRRRKLLSPSRIPAPLRRLFRGRRYVPLASPRPRKVRFRAAGSISGAEEKQRASREQSAEESTLCRDISSSEISQREEYPLVAEQRERSGSFNGKMTEAKDSSSSHDDSSALQLRIMEEVNLCFPSFCCVMMLLFLIAFYAWSQTGYAS